MQHTSLKTATGPLSYTIMHRPRVTRRLHLERDENGGLLVVAPAHWPTRLVRQTVERNLHRVEKFLAASSGRQPKPLQYVAGEKHLYLGRTYKLKTHGARQSRVAVIDREIHLWTRAQAPETIGSVLQNWYRRQAEVIFRARLEAISERAPWVKDRTLRFQQRRMKRTWGNCSSSGLIKLNTHLVKAPVNIIDSVIAHELCHLQEMNHSAAFYALLEQLNPAWKQDRACLRIQGSDYLRS